MKVKIITGVVVLLMLGAWGLKRATSGAAVPRRVFLTEEQTAGIKQADDALAELQKQFQDIAKQKEVLIAGFALSNTTIAKEGLNWAKKWKYSEFEGKKCFEEISESELKTPPQSQTPPPPQPNP